MLREKSFQWVELWVITFSSTLCRKKAVQGENLHELIGSGEPPDWLIESLKEKDWQVGDKEAWAGGVGKDIQGKCNGLSYVSLQFPPSRRGSVSPTLKSGLGHVTLANRTTAKGCKYRFRTCQGIGARPLLLLGTLLPLMGKAWPSILEDESTWKEPPAAHRRQPRSKCMSEPHWRDMEQRQAVPAEAHSDPQPLEPRANECLLFETSKCWSSES